MTLFTLTYDQSVFLVILLGSLLLLITQKVRSDLVAVFIVISLYASKVLSPDEAVSGFSSEPALVIAGVFVLTGALHVTGFSDSLGALIGRATGKSYNRMISIIMPSVSILSAFTHHVTTTAIMLPVTMNLSREHDIPSSKLLMPLAFAASLGTTITIIGAPAFLLADSTLRQAGSQGLGIFSIAPIGLALSALGTLYVLTIGRALLPDRNGAEQSVEHFKLHEYLTEIVLLEGSALIGKTVEQIEKEQPYKISIIGWIRDGAKRVSKSRPLQSGDVLLVRTTPEDMIAIRKESGVELHPIHRYGEQTEKSTDEHEESDHQFVQVVVAPRSELIRKTIGEIDVLSRYGAVIVGL
jgi:di/tricarboxylate transporter